MLYQIARGGNTMKLRDILDKEFEEIVTEFQNRGIIFEDQFKVMTSMFYKKYSTEFCELLEEETGLNVWYGYQVPYFFYYDSERYDNKTASFVAEKYQIKRGNL
jgi:hypothetical protein